MALFDQKTVQFIGYYMKQYRGRTALLIVLLFISGLAESIGLLVMLPVLEISTGTSGHARSMITRHMEHAILQVGLPPRLEVLLAVMVVAISLKAAVRLLAMKQVGYTVSRVSTDLRLTMIRAVLGTRWAYFTSQPTGRFANSISGEAGRAAGAYKSFVSMIAAAIQVLLYTAIAVLVSWQTAVAALAAGLIVVLALGRLVEMARTAARQQTRLMKSLTVRMTDALQGIKPIKAMGREGHLQPLLEEETKQINTTQERQVLASEAANSLQEPLVTVLLAVLLYFALAVQHQGFATVLVTAFIFYRVAGRIGQIQSNYQGIAGGESAFWSMMEAIEMAEAQAEPTAGTLAPPPLREGIVVESVDFAYGQTPVLTGTSLTIPAGKFVALVGRSGAGKTTIADLIVGLHAPQAGRVLIDGIPLEQIDLRGWRGQIGYVPQEMFLFHDTIYRNLTLGDSDIPREAVEEALRAAGAWEFVSHLSHGLDTVMGERGSKLSGGQRQRVAIARALVRKPKLLVLDEVTTSLDPRTEAAICATLQGLKGEVTILAISHQRAMTEAADVVYRLEGGEARSIDATVTVAV